MGPVTCPVNPVLYKTPYHGPGKLETWEVELATDDMGKDVVFKSGQPGERDSIIINPDMGSFTGSLPGKTQLISGTVYFCRVRQMSTNGKWSDWSRWHQPFKVAES
jgi:hypothetical protein